MDFELIQIIEKFIKELEHPKKKVIARNLVVDSNYQISKQLIFNREEVLIKEISSGNVYLFSNFINSKCNC